MKAISLLTWENSSLPNCIHFLIYCLIMPKVSHCLWRRTCCFIIVCVSCCQHNKCRCLLNTLNTKRKQRQENSHIFLRFISWTDQHLLLIIIIKMCDSQAVSLSDCFDKKHLDFSYIFLFSVEIYLVLRFWRRGAEGTKWGMNAF